MSKSILEMNWTDDECELVAQSMVQVLKSEPGLSLLRAVRKAQECLPHARQAFIAAWPLIEHRILPLLAMAGMRQAPKPNGELPERITRPQTAGEQLLASTAQAWPERGQRLTGGKGAPTAVSGHVLRNRGVAKLSDLAQDIVAHAQASRAQQSAQQGARQGAQNEADTDTAQVPRLPTLPRVSRAVPERAATPSQAGAPLAKGAAAPASPSSAPEQAPASACQLELGLGFTQSAKEQPAREGGKAYAEKAAHVLRAGSSAAPAAPSLAQSAPTVQAGEPEQGTPACDVGPAPSPMSGLSRAQSHSRTGAKVRRLPRPGEAPTQAKRGNLRELSEELQAQIALMAVLRGQNRWPVAVGHR